LPLAYFTIFLAGAAFLDAPFAIAFFAMMFLFLTNV
jgi:hypothetical protein